MPRVALLAVCLFVACYSPTEPDCGFICGPDDACPDGFTCNATEKRCHKNSAPADLTCESFVDAAPPIDAPDDAPPDA